MSRTLSTFLGLGFAAAAATAATALTAGSTVPLVAAGSAALGGVAGNVSTKLFEVLHRAAARRFLDRRAAIDENHLVVVALLSAQLKGLRVIQKRFDAVWPSEHRDERQLRGACAAFSASLTNYLDAEDTALRHPETLAARAETDERQIRDAVLAALPDAFDTALAARRACGEPAALAESVSMVRAALERTILTEVALRTQRLFEQIPPTFLAQFRDTSGSNSWFDLFVRDAAFRLKQDASLAAIWNAEQVALVKAIVESHTEVLGRIADDTQAIRGAVEELTRDLAVTKAEKEALAVDLARVRVEYGSTVSLVSGFLTSIIGSNVPVDQFAATLFNIAAAWKTTGDRLGMAAVSDGAPCKLAPLRDRARAAYDADDIAEVRVLLDEMERQEAVAVATRYVCASESLIETKRTKLALARSQLRHEEAAQLISEIVDLSNEENERLAALWDEHRRYYDEGCNLGLNAALEIAISIARIGNARADDIDGQGSWLFALGNALRELGDRERGTERLDAAVGAYRAALEKRRRERVPLAWAAVQNNLGNVLQALGSRKRGTECLEAATAAFRASLEEATRERAPIKWGMTQSNLGNALWALGERDSGTGRLRDAIAAYHAALQVLTRESVPREWAAIQNNLGMVLQTLGEREGQIARVEEAITAYRAALQEITQENTPLIWATTQNNLGNSLVIVGAREASTARLLEALEAFRAALRERTRNRVPLDWAMTQANVGIALSRLSQREPKHISDAVMAFRAALEELTRQNIPLTWASTKNNLGVALRMLGEHKSETAIMEESVVAFREALDERTRARVPFDWASTQNNLGNVLEMLGRRERGTARLIEAIVAYRAALSEFTEASAPHHHAIVKQRLDQTLKLLAVRAAAAVAPR